VSRCSRRVATRPRPTCPRINQFSFPNRRGRGFICTKALSQPFAQAICRDATRCLRKRPRLSAHGSTRQRDGHTCRLATMLDSSARRDLPLLLWQMMGCRAACGAIRKRDRRPPFLRFYFIKYERNSMAGRWIRLWVLRVWQSGKRFSALQRTQARGFKGILGP
jgi:hypothetical protein